MKYVSKRLLSITLAAFMAGSVIPSAALASSVNVSDSVSAGTVEYGDVIAKSGLVYNGTEQELVEPASSYAGITYSLTNKDEFSSNIPKGKDAGNYTVYYKVNNGAVSQVTATIAQAHPKLSISDVEYQPKDNDTQNSTIANNVKGAVKLKTLVNGTQYSGDTFGEVSYSYPNIAPGSTPIESGKYTVTASIAADTSASKNWAGDSASAKLTIYPKNNDIHISVNGETSVPYTGKKIDVTASAPGFTKDDFTYSSQKNGGNEVTYMPTDAGTYTIKATMKTSSKDAPSNSQEITISKAPLVFSTTGTQSDGIYGSSENGSKPYSYAYTGNKVNPEITAVLNKDTASETNVSDKISYTYKQYKDYSSSNAGTIETTSHTGLPTECGKYLITATLSNDTANWDTTSSTSTIQKLIVIEKTAPVIGNDTSNNKPTHTDGSAIIYQNNAYQFSYTGNPIDFKANATLGGVKFNGTIKYKYADMYAPEANYKDGLPSARGAYRVVAYIDATNQYGAAQHEFNVYIGSGQASITMPEKTSFVYTGKPIEYKASSNISENITYKYQKSGESSWTDGLPTNVGTYHIEATVPQTNDHSAAIGTADITITKAEPVINISDKTVEYTGSEIPLTVSSNFGKPVVKYKLSSAADSEYTTTAPKAIGIYTVKADVEETENYKAASKTAKLTISKKGLTILWSTDCDGKCTDNGSVHTASPSIKSGDIISGEEVSVYTTGNKQSKAGTYALTAELKGENVDNYTIKTGAKYSFVISSHKHVFNGTKTVTAATTKANGKIVTKCSVKGCTETKTETILRPAKLTLSKSIYSYSGKNKNPKISVKDAGGSVISSSNYTVSYPNGRSAIGKHTVTVTFNGKRYKGTMSSSFTIKPNTSKITSIKAGKKSLTVKFSKKSNQVSGYKIEYSRNSDFSDSKTITVQASASSANISGLSSGKTYYVRIASYKNVGGANYMSSWSAAQSAKVK